MSKSAGHARISKSAAFTGGIEGITGGVDGVTKGSWEAGTVTTGSLVTLLMG